MVDLVHKRLERLEAIAQPFDYDKAGHYVMLMKAFIRKAENFVSTRGLEEASPLFDIIKDDLALPDDVLKRLDEFLEAKQEYSGSAKNACRWFLKEAMIVESSDEESHYEELIQLLENGGDFYEHHGAICIRDAAMLPFVKA